MRDIKMKEEYIVTKNKKHNLEEGANKITLDDIYAAGWGKHVVDNYPRHSIDTCPICQRIIKLGRQLSAQMSAEERAHHPKIERHKVTQEEHETIKELIKEKWTPREIAECLNRCPETIRLYLHQKGLPVYTIRESYIVTNNETKKIYKLSSLKAIGELVGLSPSRLSTLINLGSTNIKGYKIDTEKSRVEAGGK